MQLSPFLKYAETEKKANGKFLDLITSISITSSEIIGKDSRNRSYSMNGCTMFQQNCQKIIFAYLCYLIGRMKSVCT